MAIFLDEQKVAISYLSKFREYAIDMRTSSGKQLIEFCPWCRAKLPSPLRDRWFDILEAELGELKGFDDSRIPEEFKTDAWWRARRL